VSRLILLRALVSLGAGLAIVAVDASSQQATVRGVVRDPAGGPLGYSVVSVLSTERQVLTGGDGRFAFLRLEPGTYLVRARHLGYAPLDTTVTVAAGGDVELELRLGRLTVQLSEMRVVAPGPCVHPGPPDPVTEPTLAVIFAQLRENADRAIALGKKYPFAFQMERRYSVFTTSRGIQPAGTDTIVIDGAARWPYRAGRIVATVNERGNMVRQVNIPGLVQLADSGFHQSHCFSYGGLQKIAGKRYIRVNFETDIGIEDPDIAGAAYLDPDGFQIRRLVMAVTYPYKLNPEIVKFEVTSAFREIVPSIVILDSAEGVTSFERPTGGTMVRTERQKTVKVVFTRETPPDAALR
jgi:hypothetical protein